MTTYPWRYGTTFKTMDEIRSILNEHYHPEYVSRLCAWLESRGGEIGIGGHWRATGEQPDKPGFAPEGKSFHQDQLYSDGFVGACAVDLVKRNKSGSAHSGVSWSDVLPQGSAVSYVWGLHCNVSSEPWHMQPIEIDGHAGFIAGGRPAPKYGYPYPGRAQEIVTVNQFTFDKRRLVDTRSTGMLRAGNTMTVVIPRDCKAAKINLVAVDPTRGGYLSVFPSGSSNPGTSDLNYSPGFTIANQVDVPCGGNRITVFTSKDTHVIVDLVGVWN